MSGFKPLTKENLQMVGMGTIASMIIGPDLADSAALAWNGLNFLTGTEPIVKFIPDQLFFMAGSRFIGPFAKSEFEKIK